MNEKQKSKKKKKPGQWGVLDILLGVLGLAAVLAIAIGGFKVAKWVIATYM